LDNSTAYIQSWLKVLKNDKNIFLTAAQSAQKAFDHILGVTVKDKEPAEELVEA
jgi:antirestriction protein ArdC